MEHEVRDPASVTRGQNALYVLPHDWASVTHFLAPLVERVDASVHEIQLLVITADDEAAAAIAAAAVRLTGDREITPLAATSARRAARLLKLRPPQIVSGAPGTLLELVRGATLKLHQLKAVVLAWADELSGSRDQAAIEMLMGEVPRESARVIVASALTPAVEAIAERYARRARRIGVPTTHEADAARNVEYLTTSSAGKLSALRRLLDELDPASAAVVVRTDDSERMVGELLRSLGYAADASVRVARAAGAEPLELVVLHDVPASREELRESVGPHTGRVIALVQPRQLASLRSVVGAGVLAPVTLPEAGIRARNREDVVRGELRETLGAGTFARELMTLEPLLDEYDGIEIAAAALQLLERERSTPRTAPAAEARAQAPGSMARVFVNVGTRDNARPGDLVGAIVNETGVAREAVGRIEIRDSHSLVEIASEQAESVASRLTGTTIRGRRVQARVDQERPSRGPASGGRGGERAPRGERPAGRRDDRGRAPRREGRGDRPRTDFARPPRPRNDDTPREPGADERPSAE